MRCAGLFAEASGGTVFLDEIGEMPLTEQSKMLRVLESRETQRLGSARSLPIDVRVVAATNQRLEELVGQRKFRSDLFYRLNITRVHLPPLRERKEHIPGLIAHFLAVLNAQMGRQVVGLEADLHDSLLEYDWPGCPAFVPYRACFASVITTLMEYQCPWRLAVSSVARHSRPSLFCPLH